MQTVATKSWLMASPSGIELLSCFDCWLAAVTALKGRNNSAQCVAKRSVGENSAPGRGLKARRNSIVNG